MVITSISTSIVFIIEQWAHHQWNSCPCLSLHFCIFIDYVTLGVIDQSFNYSLKLFIIEGIFKCLPACLRHVFSFSCVSSSYRQMTYGSYRIMFKWHHMFMIFVYLIPLRSLVPSIWLDSCKYSCLMLFSTAAVVLDASFDTLLYFGLLY